MKQFFQNLGDKLQRWMSGRYGQDELYKALFLAALVFLFLSCIPNLQFMWIIACGILIFSTYRSFSKNIEQRRRERSAYLRFTGRIKDWFTIRKKAWSERKTHRYYKCPDCGTMLRVPKGKGKIKITCPQCHKVITKKT